MRNLVSGIRFAAYAEARRARTNGAIAAFCAVPFSPNAVIAIRTEADAVQACAAAEDMAALLSFSSFEQAFLTAGTASLARMIMNWPGQGEIAIALVSKAGARGLAIVARFKSESNHSRIEGIRPGWDCFNASARGGETVATLVKWCRPEPPDFEEPDVS